MFLISYETRFSASHFVRGYKGKGEPLHEHNWRVEVGVASEGMDEIGIAFDFEDLKRETEVLTAQLEKKNLNELVEFQETNPTAENLSKWFYKRLQKRLNGVQLDQVRVWEAEGCSVVYRED
ncbi:6-carboxytetrahydropterin synthase [candidate division TA06 bacterium]|nr:6-carboxytetrahydropterin synthase [candidate division TA06 bacterium]